MSQQTTTPETESDSENTAEQSDRSLADVLVDELSFVSELLDSVSEEQLADMSDEDLVSVRSEAKTLEEHSEDFRKKQADSVLKDRVEPGDRIGGLLLVESHSKRLASDVSPESVIMRAVSEGIDYNEFVSIKASKLATVQDERDVELGEISEYSYTYFQ